MSATGSLADAIAELTCVVGRLEAERPTSYRSLVPPLDAALLRVEELVEALAQSSWVLGGPCTAQFDREAPVALAALSAARSSPALGAAVAGCETPNEPTEARNLERLRREFETHGFDRPDTERQRIAAIDAALARETTTYARNVHRAETATGGDLQKLSTTDDPRARRELYRSHNRRAAAPPHDNLPRVREILRLRRARARLVGRSNFAELVLSDRALRNPSEVRNFLADLRRRAEPAFERETQSLLAFDRDHCATSKRGLHAWDVAYIASRQRLHETGYDPEDLRPYLGLQTVLDGMLELAERLFDLRFEPTDECGWHPDVTTYRIDLGEGETGLATFDLLARNDKDPGRWMQRLPSPRGFQRSAALVANFPPDSPGLLHRQVRGLFHEFGHLLHHLLGRTDVPGLAGTRVPWDFVEFPSLLLEHWAWEREALDLFAHHRDTAEPLPTGAYRSLRASRRFRAASALMRQLGLAELDLALHLDYDPDGVEPPDAFARKILAPFGAAPVGEDDAMVASFGHVFGHPIGYACGYYAYRWADALAADVFSRFEAQGVLDRELGLAVRNEVLERGNHRAPADSFFALMGRDPRIEPLLRREGLT